MVERLLNSHSNNGVSSGEEDLLGNLQMRQPQFNKSSSYGKKSYSCRCCKLQVVSKTMWDGNNSMESGIKCQCSFGRIFGRGPDPREMDAISDCNRYIKSRAKFNNFDRSCCSALSKSFKNCENLHLNRMNLVNKT